MYTARTIKKHVTEVAKICLVAKRLIVNPGKDDSPHPCLVCNDTIPTEHFFSIYYAFTGTANRDRFMWICDSCNDLITKKIKELSIIKDKQEYEQHLQTMRDAIGNAKRRIKIAKDSS